MADDPVPASPVTTVPRLDLGQELSRRYGLEATTPPVPLEGGYANEVHRLGEVVLRLAPAGSTNAELAYEHELVAQLAAAVPEIHAPLAALDGGTYFRLGDRLAAVYPFVPGCHADRRSERQRGRAAEVLARVHGAGLELGAVPPRPGKPALRDLDWRSNWMWDLDQALSFSPWPNVEAEWEELGGFVTGCQGLCFGPVHSDYFPGNVIVRHGVVRAVIDWDHAKPEWLVWELARSLWEFCKDKRRHALRSDRAVSFLAAYRAAGGPVPKEEAELLIPFMRCIRLEELLHHLTEGASGGRWDPWYTMHNWRSLENLRHLKPLRA